MKIRTHPSHEVQIQHRGPSHIILNRLPKPLRSHFTNLFLQAVRTGLDTPDMVVVAVVATTIHHLRRAHRWHDKANLKKFSPMQRVLEAHPEEALGLAAWALAWEALPRAEKAERKAPRAQAYQRWDMAGQEATDKQRAYLRALGYDGPVESRLHASRQIDTLRQGGSRDVA